MISYKLEKIVDHKESLLPYELDIVMLIISPLKYLVHLPISWQKSEGLLMRNYRYYSGHWSVIDFCTKFCGTTFYPYTLKQDRINEQE